MTTWRQRIDPVLCAEEDRNAFDIHNYGGAILERLGTVTEQQQLRNPRAAEPKPDMVPFQRVVACDNRFEVARMFAAMLQRVNNRWAGCGGLRASQWALPIWCALGLALQRCPPSLWR